MTRKLLRYDEKGNSYWEKVEEYSQKVSNNRNTPKEDLTLSGYLQKHGGIQSPIDGSVYSSERSYKEHLKKNNCVIKDW